MMQILHSFEPKMRHTPLLLLFLGLSAGAHADSLGEENARLKQQISALQSRVETLEHACPAAASSGVVVPAAAVPVSSSVTAAANLDGTPQPTASLPEKKPPRPYSDAGCDRGLFTGPAAGRWQKLSNWNAVKEGLGPTEVETAIGVEHYDVAVGAGRTQWQYGRCSSSYAGTVEFLDGRVVSVVPPDR